MNAQHSIGTPVRCWISAIGLMSATTVRAAQLARIRSRPSPIARASRSTSLATCGPAPGRPMSAVSMPSASMCRRMSIFWSMVGDAHRRRLQPVAQRLVVEHRDRLARALRRRVVVPVVNQRMRR